MIKSIFRGLGLDEKFMQYRAVTSWISHKKSGKAIAARMFMGDPPIKRHRSSPRFTSSTRRGCARPMRWISTTCCSKRSVCWRMTTICARQYNRRFEFVMIDEYQDTNRSQYELMRLLTEAPQERGVVGDEDQSIYGWRGADIRNILDFERDFPNATVIRLEQNYRSTKNILEAASAVVAQQHRAQGQMAVDRIGRRRAHRPIRRVRWRAGSAVHRRHHRAPALGESRATASACSTAPISNRARLKRRCAAIGRQYVVLGGFSFYQRAEIKDALAYLKVLASPHDSVSLLRIINTPARGIGKSTVEQIEQYALENELSVWSAIGRMLEERAVPDARRSGAASVSQSMIHGACGYAGHRRR